MKIAKLGYTKQGYSYIKCTKEDCFSWGGMAICDSCGNFINEEVYLIFILGQACCQKCFQEWAKSASTYKDDLCLQQQNQERWYKLHGFKAV